MQHSFSILYKECSLYEKIILKLSFDQFFYDKWARIFSDVYKKDITSDEIEHWTRNNSIIKKIMMYRHFIGADGHSIEFYDPPIIYVLSDNYSPDSDTLSAYGNIPKLYLHEIGIAKSEFGFFDKILAHDDFIATTLIKLFGLDMSSKKDIVNFLLKNKNKIDSLRKSFSQHPKFIGGGADGRAFDIGGDLILKIFVDEFSYNKAIDAIKRLHNNPDLAKTEAMIYDVGIIGEFDDINIYYYIIEKMDPDVSNSSTNVQNQLRLIVKNIESEIDRNENLRELKSKIELKNYSKNIAKHIKYIVKQIVPKIIGTIDTKLIEKSFPQLKSTWLSSFVEEIIMKYLTSRTDLHFGNLGITNYGEFRYFDPAYSDWQSAINV